MGKEATARCVNKFGVRYWIAIGQRCVATTTQDYNGEPKGGAFIATGSGQTIEENTKEPMVTGRSDGSYPEKIIKLLTPCKR